MIELACAVLIGMTLHEAAHAWTAARFGDRTAELQGRVSLNPLAHIDPLGTLIVPVGTWLLLGIPAGWGRSVPIRRLLLSRTQYIAVLLAGPGANLWTAALFYTAGLEAGATVNVVLATFNMLPIPPLDGGRILQEVLR